MVVNLKANLVMMIMGHLRRLPMISLIVLKLSKGFPSSEKEQCVTIAKIIAFNLGLLVLKKESQIQKPPVWLKSCKQGKMATEEPMLLTKETHVTVPKPLERFQGGAYESFVFEGNVSYEGVIESCSIFYWPKLRRSVAEFVKTCHVYQMVGKPNQNVKSDPLNPVPAFDELLAG